MLLQHPAKTAFSTANIEHAFRHAPQRSRKHDRIEHIAPPKVAVLSHVCDPCVRRFLPAVVHGLLHSIARNHGIRAYSNARSGAPSIGKGSSKWTSCKPAPSSNFM